MRNLIGLSLILLVGCSSITGGGSGPSIDKARGTAAAAGGFAAAVANVPNAGDSNMYPSNGDNPSPSPSPTPSGKCTNCDGRHWVGDGRIMKPCPVCNADGKLPLTANEFGEYVPYNGPETPFSGPSNNPPEYQPLPVGSAGAGGTLPSPPSPAPASSTKAVQELKTEVDGLLDALNSKTTKPKAASIPTVIVRVSPTDSALVSAWIKESKAQWEKGGWTVKVEPIPPAQQSYFLVTDEFGRTTKVVDYLNVRSLEQAREQKSAK